MQFLVKNDDDTIMGSNIEFDDNGNLYLDFSQHIKYFNSDVKFYTCQLEVDNKDKPVFDFNNYNHIDESSIELGMIKEVSEDHQVDDYEFNEEYPSSCIPLKFYPEKRGYLFTEPDIDYSETYEGVFHFLSSNSYSYKISKRENGEINALYDTFIELNNSVIFNSQLIGDVPLYIVKLVISDGKPGILMFRKIGYSEPILYHLTLHRNGTLTVNPV